MLGMNPEHMNIMYTLSHVGCYIAGSYCDNKVPNSVEVPLMAINVLLLISNVVYSVRRDTVTSGNIKSIENIIVKDELNDF